MKKKTKSLYILIAFTPETGDRKYSYKKGKNGEVSVYSERIGIFDTVKQAEDTIHRLVSERDLENKRWGGWERYFGFYLDELYLNDCIYNDNCISHFESRRSYLSTGELNCFSDLDDRCEKKFAGREIPIDKIKPGDYALCISGDEIIPVLVDQNPMTKDEWSREIQKGVYGDVTDDSGIVFIAGYGHSHPFSPNVFPLWNLEGYRISREIKSMIRKEKEGYYKGESL